MTKGEYFWCTRHDRVEWGDSMCPARHRLGPYDTPNEAERALERVEQRNEAWQAADEQWAGTGGEGDDWPVGR